MKKFDKFLKTVVSVPAIIAGVGLIILMLVTVADVLMRLIINQSIVGSNEISLFIMIFAGFLGIAWCGLNDSHIKVDLVVGLLPDNAQQYFFKFNFLLVAVISGLVSVASYFGAQDVKRLNSVSELLSIPQYPQYMLVAFSYLLLCLTALALFVRSFIIKVEVAAPAPVEEG